MGKGRKEKDKNLSFHLGNLDLKNKKGMLRDIAADLWESQLA